MDEKGRLLIRRNDETVFRGRTFEENGLSPYGENRHARRKEQALQRTQKKLAKVEDDG